MVKPDDSHLETNLERLLRATLEPGALPGSGARSRAFNAVTNLIRARRTAFPESILGMLGILIVFAAVRWLSSLMGVSSTVAAAALFRLILYLGLINLLVIPFAGLVIIIRKRRSNV